MSTLAPPIETSSPAAVVLPDGPGALAQKVFHAYVNKATGKADVPVALGLPATEAIRFEVLETYSISTVCDETRYKGISNNDSHDFYVSNNGRKYAQAVADEVESLKTDEAIFNGFVATFERASYLEHAPSGSVLDLYRPRRRIMHHMSCQNCGQTGQVDCHAGCDYNGKVNCLSCHGRGKTTCSCGEASLLRRYSMAVSRPIARAVVPRSSRSMMSTGRGPRPV